MKRCVITSQRPRPDLLLLWSRCPRGRKLEKPRELPPRCRNLWTPWSFIDKRTNVLPGPIWGNGLVWKLCNSWFIHLNAKAEVVDSPRHQPDKLVETDVAIAVLEMQTLQLFRTLAHFPFHESNFKLFEIDSQMKSRDTNASQTWFVVITKLCPPGWWHWPCPSNKNTSTNWYMYKQKLIQIQCDLF